MSYRILSGLGLIFATTVLGFAGDQTVAAPWSGLAPMIEHRRVATVLPGVIEIEGKVVRVEPEGLRVRITRTSDKKAFPKGERVIPRQSISVLRVIEYRKTARLLCTLGAIGGTAAIVATRDIGVYEGAAVVLVPTLTVAGAAGAGVAGYYIGTRIDRKITFIRVIPEP